MVHKLSLLSALLLPFAIGSEDKNVVEGTNYVRPNTGPGLAIIVGSRAYATTFYHELERLQHGSRIDFDYCDLATGTCERRNVLVQHYPSVCDFPWCWKIIQSGFYTVEPLGFQALANLSVLIYFTPLEKATDVYPQSRDKLNAVRFSPDRFKPTVPPDTSRHDWIGHFFPFESHDGEIKYFDTRACPPEPPLDRTKPSVAYDVIPLQKDEMLGFFRIVQGLGAAGNDHPFEIWHTTNVRGIAEWKLLASVPCLFDDHFRAFDDAKGNHYLVTRAGKVYWIKNETQGRPRMDPLWTALRSLVQYVISHPESKRTFVVWNGHPLNRVDDQTWHYFELSDQVGLKTFSYGRDVKPLDFPGDTKQLLEVTRFIAEREQLVK